MLRCELYSIKMYAQISDGKSQPTEKTTIITECLKKYTNEGLYFEICFFTVFVTGIHVK